MSALAELAWPSERVAEAMIATAQASGLPVRSSSPRGGELGGVKRTPATVRDWPSLEGWLRISSAEMGLEASVVVGKCAQAKELLAGLGPALVAIDWTPDGTPHWLAVVGARGGTLRLVTPGHRTKRVSLDEVSRALTERWREHLAADGLEDMLHEAQLPEPRRRAIVDAMQGEHLGAYPIGPCLVLRPHPGESPWALARHAGLARTVGVLVASYALKSLFVLAGWYLIGRGALGGRLETAWLFAWVLAISSTVPIGVVANWAQGRFALVASRLLKQRLLYGALRIHPDRVRKEGVGQLLGRVLESSTIENLALGGSVQAVLALVDLVLAVVVLGFGAGGVLHLALFVGYALLIAWFVRRYYRRSLEWTRERLRLTDGLVERMVGHRTRIAQEAPSRWHLEEDQGVEAYLTRTRERDAGALPLALVPRGWVVLGIAGLIPAFVSGSAPSALAIGLGGVVLALQAFDSLASSSYQLAEAAVAWRQVAPLFEAATLPKAPGDTASALARENAPDARPILEAKDLAFRYQGRSRDVLSGCSLTVHEGDRLLLEGPSGGGKSTLGALLAGLRRPTSGLVLLNGLDIASLGDEAWRGRVVVVPQFHENHILSGSFALNALMGSEWPPSPAQLEDLEALCQELGLGPLLDRMPSRLQQTVGESGWQLSHGERSRLYIARALMQKDVRMLVLDESFAALDPVTLERCVGAVLSRAKTVMVIAHP